MTLAARPVRHALCRTLLLLVVVVELVAASGDGGSGSDVGISGRLDGALSRCGCSAPIEHVALYHSGWKHRYR